jgi:hypothetical protein
MKPDFTIMFNDNQQWIDVYLEDVTQEEFRDNGGGDWGYFIATWDFPEYGQFGRFHFVKSLFCYETLVHEVFHAVVEIARSLGDIINEDNEEDYACINHEIFGEFIKHYEQKT